MHTKQTGAVGSDEHSPATSHDSSSYRALDRSYSLGWDEDRLKNDYDYIFPSHSDFGPNLDSSERAMTAPGQLINFRNPTNRSSVSFCIPPESLSTEFYLKGIDNIEKTYDYTPKIQEGIAVANVAPVTQVYNENPEGRRDSFLCDSLSPEDILPRRYLRFSPSAKNNLLLPAQKNQDQQTNKMQSKQDDNVNQRLAACAGNVQIKRKTTDSLTSAVDLSRSGLKAHSYPPSKILKQEPPNDYYAGSKIQMYSMPSSQPSLGKSVNSESYSDNMVWDQSHFMNHDHTVRYNNNSPLDGLPLSKTKASFQPTHHYCTPIVTGNGSHTQSQKSQFSVDGDSDSHLIYYHRPCPSSSPSSDKIVSIENKGDSSSPRRYRNSPITTSKPSQIQLDHNFMSSDFTSHILPPYQQQSFHQGYDIATNLQTFPQSLSNRDTHAESVPKNKQDKKKEKPPRKKKMYSDYIGVTFNKTHAKFQACITHYRKQYYLGRFMIAAEAARAYDVAARNLKGNEWKINFKTDIEYEEARKLELEAVADKQTTNSIDKGFASMSYGHPVDIVTSSSTTRLPANLYRPSPLYAPGHGYSATSWSGQGFPPTNTWLDSTPSGFHANLMSVPIMTPYGNVSRDNYGKKLFTTPFMESTSSGGTWLANTHHLTLQQPKPLCHGSQIEAIKTVPPSIIDKNLSNNKDSPFENPRW